MFSKILITHLTYLLIKKIVQSYYSNEKDYNKHYYIYFNNKAFRAKINAAIKNAKRKSNTALGYRFINSNIFFKASNKTATAIGENKLIIEIAAIFKNFR